MIQAHRPQRHWVLRFILGLAATFVILAMHQTFGEVVEAATSQDRPAAAAASVVDLNQVGAPSAPAEDPPLAGCGVAAMCLAMILALGAAVILRRRGGHYAVRRANHALTTGLRCASAVRLAPPLLQRTVALRC